MALLKEILKGGVDVASSLSDKASGLLDEILELYKTEPLTARKMAKRSGILDEIDDQIPRPKGDVSNADALRAEANAQRVGDADYKGQHSAPMSGDNAPLHDLSQVYPDDIYSSKGLQYYGTGDNAIDSESMDIINSLKGKPDQTVTMYRSVPSDAGDVDINAGDWVSLSESYVKQHGEAALNGDYKIISKEVPASQLFTNGDSINEFGFDPSSKGLFDQYDMDLYHSTYADIDQFDPDMVDIGVHLGTPQQAKNRLNDTFDPDGGGARFKTENYREGANVMPVKVRSGGVLEMEDVGDWKDSQQVLSELTKNPLFENDLVINDLIAYADEIQPSYYGGEMSWRDSPENREVLDDIRNHLQSKGFDTVKYLNQVENAYGSDAGLTEAATKSMDLLSKRINEIQKVAHSRGPDINSVPDPSAPNFQEKMDAFLNGKPSYTDAETVELDKLRSDARLIGSAPESQADPNSYISLDPDRNVRSRFAKFESERGSLLASNPVATAAGLGGVLAMTGSDDSYAGGPESQYDPTSMSGVLGISPEMLTAMAQRDALDQQRMAADEQRYGQYADDQMMPREQTYSEQLGNYLSNLRYGDDSNRQQQEMARVLSGILDLTPVGSADALKLGAQQREAGNSFEGWLNSIGGAAEAAIPLAGLGYKYGKKGLQGLMEKF